MGKIVDERGVGMLAESLYRGYMGYLGSAVIVRHPYSQDVIERIEKENTGPAPVPTERIVRKDGSAHYFDLSSAVCNIAADPNYQAIHDRLWLTGALLTLGDELDKSSYFDRGPDLEFIRQLRNSIGHGNRFHFLHGEPRRAAHFTGADQRGMPDGTITPPGQAHTFEITPGLNGKEVLFDYIGPGDVSDLLLFVGTRLLAIAAGDPPRHIFTQRP